MAFKSFPVAIGSTDTDVFECPAATEAAVVLLVSNVSSSARTYTLKFYKASLDVTRTLLSSVSVAANTAAKVPAPISMEAGDKIIMSCSNANDIVVGGTITLSGTVQVISTFVSEGEWDSETTYTANVSIVSRSGNSYLARPNAEPNVDQDPATATDFWTLLAEKGATGDGDLSAANNLNDLADKPTAFANIKQAATTEASGVVELATDAETQTGTDTARAITPANLTAAGIKQGKHTIPFLASGMIPRTTNGPAVVISELATNDVMLHSLDFDQTTEEGAGFWVPMPKSWNAGTVTFQPIWTAGSGTGGVVWSLAGRAYADDDALDQAMGTAQTSEDGFIAAGDMHIGPESSAITIAGTPAAGEPVYFEVKRVIGDEADTLTADAKLIGIKLYVTLNAATDA